MFGVPFREGLANARGIVQQQGLALSCAQENKWQKKDTLPNQFGVRMRTRLGL